MTLCPAESLRNYTPLELNIIMSDAVTKFNIKPSSAREYLVAKKALQGLPSELAQFIAEFTPQLSKRRIGEFIGKYEAYNQAVCDSLMYKYNFSGMFLDDAIRHMLQHFRLPGEAQQIDRILEKFSQSYHNQNPGLYPNQDLVHILSFSLMMLNTDLHNQVRDHPSLTSDCS